MPNPDNSTNVAVNQFTGGMKKDLSLSLLPPDSWTHARNAVTNSHDGKLGVIGNEPANYLCIQLPYSYIGAIHIVNDKWAVFSTDDLNSEIGIFEEGICSYSKIVNDRGLGFKRTNRITGSSKKNFDCTYSIYFDDALNPSRTLNIDRPVYQVKQVKQVGSCNVPVYSDKLDIEALRLARLLTIPTLKLNKSVSGGSLPNGSYQIAVAYTVNEVRVTDYFTPSNIQPLFSHRNLGGALAVTLDNLDTDFDEFELVLISTINEQTNARKLGIYSTHQKSITIGNIDPRATTVPLEYIPLQTPAYDKSDANYQVADYLLRVGVYTKPDFNYQPLANNITAKWVALELPANHYAKGGNVTSYLRDEVYAFFIRWIYNTGQKSASYHIPGRMPSVKDRAKASGRDVYEISQGIIPETWQVKNTASITSAKTYSVEQGNIIAEGLMGYWESTEKYPDDNIQVWADRCGRNICHHKFPGTDLVPLSGNGGATINVLGVKFDNITHPLDFNGNPIADIVGYEILCGTREGNKSIIAKGMISNMAQYDIPDNITDMQGLYPNYPYNDLRLDPFLSKQKVLGGCDGKHYDPMGTFRKDIFTFHSPETSFRNPFLSAAELKIEAELSGTVTGNFEPVFMHPKHRMLRDFAVYTAGVVGVGAGLTAIMGKKSTTSRSSSMLNIGYTQVGVSTGTSLGNPLANPTLANLTGGFLTNIPGLGAIGANKSITTEGGVMSQSPALAIASSAFLFTYFMGQGGQQAIEAIRKMVPFEQYAYQYNSHGFYDTASKVADGNTRRQILEAEYLEPHLQDFASQFRINNLFRSRAVVLQLADTIENPSTVDNTRQTIGDQRIWDNPTKSFVTTTSGYYASLKVNLPAQYGQVDSIIQVPITSGTLPTIAEKGIKFSSPAMFGGDQYITRYTEKSTMFYFNDWLAGQPDGFEKDYNLSYNLPYARYWINSNDYDFSALMQPFVKTAAGVAVGSEIGHLFDTPGSSLVSTIGAIAGGAAGIALSLNDFKNQVLPNDYAYLDRNHKDCTSRISFYIKEAYFYLFCNGVKDFFVESELNLAAREYDDEIATRFYDYTNYTDLQSLFRSDIIKSGNNFKYDYSLSISRLLQHHISWGAVLPRDYNPAISEQCYSYFPNRLIYSLPQQEELKKDNWTAFLANNYKDFSNHITSIKNINKTGAVIFFQNDSPVYFQGVDQLQTEGGIKITIGDGGLFNQPLQSISNADKQYEEGSCQNRQSIISTPVGLFSINQNQGKIYEVANSLKEVSEDGNLWWFARYLPSKLLVDFPDFEYPDNTLLGVGCLSGYDNINKVVYFSKVDYQVKLEYKGRITYKSKTDFVLDRYIPVKLGDPAYFDNASFTISYDAKTRTFISVHDWIPEAYLGSKDHVFTIKNGGIWKHNDRCDLFCNFYGQDFPFEVEMATSTGQDVTSLRSIEYVLQAFRYFNDCRDEFHILDENFDQAYVWNSEQHSGLLRLHIKPKNNPFAANQYPSVTSNGTDILFSKEQNKYRFNSFYDLISDRGEFTHVERPMWNNAANGYTKTVNPIAVNYGKSALQKKRFRHYTQQILLRKTISGSTKLVLTLTNSKQLKSLR